MNASNQGWQLPAFFLPIVCSISLMLASPTAALALAQPQSGDVSASVSILGAVNQPARVSGPVTLQDALQAAGGLSDDAYAYGAVLLRATRLLAGVAECVSREAELFALQSGMTGGAVRLPQEQLNRRMETGEAVRLPVSLLPLQTGVADQVEVTLINGDILFVPSRPSTVAVVLPAQGIAEVVAYTPGWKAEDYIANVGGRTKWSSNVFSLYLPTGELRDLKLNLWNYQLHVVPPGSVVISDERSAYKKYKVCAEL